MRRWNLNCELLAACTVGVEIVIHALHNKENFSIKDWCDKNTTVEKQLYANEELKNYMACGDKPRWRRTKTLDQKSKGLKFNAEDHDPREIVGSLFQQIYEYYWE